MADVIGDDEGWDAVQAALDAQGSELTRLRARVAVLEGALGKAIECIEDMVAGDDGQAHSEAERALPLLRQALGGTDGL